MTVLYIVLVVGIAAAFGWVDDSLATARLAQPIIFVVTKAVWWYSWWNLFQPRPAMTAQPRGSYLVTIGFQKLYRTWIQIRKHYKALAWFYPAM